MADIKEIKSKLTLIYTLLALQISLLQTTASSKLVISTFLATFTYIGLAYFIMRETLKGQFLRDYLGEKPKSDKEKHKEFILHGEIIRSDLDEDLKEERFLRVAGFNNTIKRRLSIALYLASFFIIQTIQKKIDPTSTLSSHFLPLLIGGISLLTTSFGQLLGLPLLTLVCGIFMFDASRPFEASQVPLISLSLVLVAINLRLILNIPYPGVDSLSNTLKRITSAIGSLLICFWIFNAIIPMKNTPPKKKAEPIQKLNKNLGKAFKSPAKDIQMKRARIKDINARAMSFPLPQTLPAMSFNQALKQMDSQLDFFKELLDSGFFKNLNIPDMDRNYLRNTHRELAEQHQKLAEQLFKKEEYSEEDIKAALDFFDKLQNLSKELSKVGLETKISQSEKFIPPEEAFNSALKAATDTELNPFKEGLKHNEEYAKIFDKKTPEDSPTDLKKKTLPKEKEISKHLQDIQKKKQLSNKVISEEIERESYLIPPKVLERTLDILKKVLFLMLGLFIISFISKLFAKPKVKSTNDQEVNTLKKSLLRSSKYNSPEEEIRDRYNKFLEVTKNIHFDEDEEEPPPPKVLEYYLRGKNMKNQKALNYLTEVFSRSFYGEQKFQAKTLKNYRKAYKTLIKSL